MTTEKTGQDVRKRPLVIGVTGNIACGKSTVMGFLGELGAELIDADAVYHELIAPHRPLWYALRDRFGDVVINGDGTIDRRALGRIVFFDAAALSDLDRITHPAVIEAIRDRVANAQRPILAVDAVKLIESGMAPLCDSVWLVTCDREQQLARLGERNGLARVDAERRVDVQPSPEAKLALVDAVIDNSGPLRATYDQVVAAWRALTTVRVQQPFAE
jgi:dephospho-CoA kinase